MYNTKLIIDIGSPAVELDLKADVPISINLSIADISQPDKRNGSFSKTVSIIGKAADQKFEFIFDPTTSSIMFNPNLKINASIVVDDVEVIKGHLQLKKVVEIPDNDRETIEYETVIFGNISTIFTEMSDDLLTDLDFSEYDHTFNRTNQKNSWATSIIKNGGSQAFAYGEGYVYPIIDYGYKQFGQDHYYHVEHLRPMLAAREYLAKIFDDHGFQWSSNFLDSAFFKRLYIPHNGDALNMSAATLANYEFYAGRLATSGAQNIPMQYIGGIILGWKNSISYADYNNAAATINLPNDDSTAPFNDAGGIYNTATGVYTANKTGWINLKGTCKFEVKLNFPATAVSAVGGMSIDLAMMKSVDGGSTWQYQGGWFNQSPFGAVELTSSYQTGQINFDFGSFHLTGTNQIKIVYIINGTGQTGKLTFWTGAGGTGSQVTTGTASYDLRQIAGTEFIVTQSYKKLLDGNSLVMNDCIPLDIKQKDFFKAIINEFNLYVDVDKSDPNILIIEPRDDFYAGGSVKDWTQKKVHNLDWETEPMGETTYKKYKWRYKEDKDYYNTLYQNEFKQTYGEKNYAVENDFYDDENITEVIFSPTPIVDNQQNSMIVPKIFDFKNGQVLTMKHNIRLVYYGGVKSSGNSWQFTDSTNSQTETTYPFCGMVDDPINNTVSIEFAAPNRIFYTANQYTYTDNNLFNAYYYVQTKEITDRDSKKVTGYFHLTPEDIATFDFRDKIFIENAFYIALKVLEYNPKEQGLTRVELLKLKSFSSYVPTTFTAGDVETDLGGEQWAGRTSSGGTGNNEGAGNNVAIGDGVAVFSEGSMASGSNIIIAESSQFIKASSSDGIRVGEDCINIDISNCQHIVVANECENIKLINCKNLIIESGVTDFVGNGLDGDTITPDFSTVHLPTDEGSMVTVTTDTTTSLDKKKYLVDATLPPGSPPATEVVISLFAPPYSNTTQFFIKIDNSANTVKIQSSQVGVLINGAANYILNNQYDSVNLTWTGTEWIIEL